MSFNRSDAVPTCPVPICRDCGSEALSAPMVRTRTATLFAFACGKVLAFYDDPNRAPATVIDPCPMVPPALTITAPRDVHTCGGSPGVPCNRSRGHAGGCGIDESPDALKRALDGQ